MKTHLETSAGATPAPRQKLTTVELAKLTKSQPKSIRVSLCKRGHFLGLRPVKLPNGRLLWDAGEAYRIVSGA